MDLDLNQLVATAGALIGQAPDAAALADAKARFLGKEGEITRHM